MKSQKAKIAVKDLKIRKDVKGGTKLDSVHSPTSNKTISNTKGINVVTKSNT